MQQITIDLDQLKPAIGDRVDLTWPQMVEVLKKDAADNDKIITEFYGKNPVFAEFVQLVDSKQRVSKEEYKKAEAEFFEKYPEYKDINYQIAKYNKLRWTLPEGALTTVRGGFAVMKTENRSGRSPSGTLPVLTDNIKDVIDFNYIKGYVTEDEFLQAAKAVIDHMADKTLYETNRYVGQGELAIPVRTITEKSNAAAFTMNMFRAEPGEGKTPKYEGWTILQSPSFLHPDKERFQDGVFKFTDYKRRMIVIGGSGYNGEIKKGMFVIANHLYPLDGHLSLHCSSTYDSKSDEVTLIFGLSGTGKSTVASGMETSKMLSDDETAINRNTGKSFNIENGNYYKTGGLLSEPKVLEALENMDIHTGNVALYENVVVAPEGYVVLGADPSANGRVSVPLTALKGAINGGMYPTPRRIIILSRDVNAILDPINILSKEQIVFYLNLGYTSKTPGTEVGVFKPIPTYSKWEGGPFYDLKDELIMDVLLKYLNENPVEGVLLNSGEGGGPYGSEDNERFAVDVTIVLARNFMEGNLTRHLNEHPEDFEENSLLGTKRPKNIPGLPEEIVKTLHARALWQKNGYGDKFDEYAHELFSEFKAKAEKSLTDKSEAIQKILASGPRV